MEYTIESGHNRDLILTCKDRDMVIELVKLLNKAGSPRYTFWCEMISENGVVHKNHPASKKVNEEINK